jgi:2-dehydro-3-deoxyphosphooctonate aldolase (KDO 8-P synthase)
MDYLFETHFDPKNAKSDGANMLDLSQLENLVSNLVEIRKTINKF